MRRFLKQLWSLLTHQKSNNNNFLGCAPPNLTSITEGFLLANASFYEIGTELVYQCNQNFSLRMATTRCENSSAGVLQFTLDVATPPPACLLSKY